MLTGWVYWVQDGPQIRQITVAEPEEGVARAVIQKVVPSGQILSHHKIPEGVISFIALRRGQYSESHALPGSEIKPRGTSG